MKTETDMDLVQHIYRMGIFMKGNTLEEKDKERY